MNTNQAEQWALIVNGVPKPWPIKNYLETPITIDLNWGIDTDVYESDPLTFNVSDVINGVPQDGVVADLEKHQIICNIPIQERTKTIRVIIDWTNFRNNIKTDLKAVVGGKVRPMDEGSLQLVGKEIVSPIEFYFKGAKCESGYVDGADMIKVSFPSRSNYITRYLLMISAFVVIFFLGLFSGNLFFTPKVVTEYVEKTDTLRISQSLDIAKGYLKKDRWRYNEMELIPELSGLFNDMKYYRFDKIVSRLDRADFKNIPQVRNLLEVVREMEISIGSKSLKYFEKYHCGDEITLNTYIRTLCREQNRLGQDSLINECLPRKIGAL